MLKAFIACTVLIASGAFAAPDISIPPLSRPVEDLVKIFSTEEVAQMETFIREVKRTTQAQFQVLTVPSLEGLPIEEYSIKVVNKWKLGDAKRDDGLLILISPTTRDTRIEVGQGLEGSIPDAIASRTLRSVMTPAFKASDYGGGTYRALRSLAAQIDPKLANFEATGPSANKNPYAESSSSGRGRQRAPSWIYILFALIFLLSRLFGGHRRGVSFWGGGGGGGGGSWGGGGGGFSGGGSSGRW